MCKKLNAVIFAAGEMSDIEYERRAEDIVIAADRGYLFAKCLGIEPELVVGDFDSLDSPPVREGVTVLPREKDDTDTAYAIKCALDMGVKRIFICGGLGGRLDHTFANIQLLTYIAEHGGIGYLVGERELMCVLRDTEALLHGEHGQTVSVFSLSERSSGVYERGFKYTLENSELKSGFPLGVSNELEAECAELSVANGELLVCANGSFTDFIAKNRLSKEEVNRKLNIYF